MLNPNIPTRNFRNLKAFHRLKNHATAAAAAWRVGGVLLLCGSLARYAIYHGVYSEVGTYEWSTIASAVWRMKEDEKETGQKSCAYKT